MLKHRSKEPKVDQFDYEKMAILDFVIGNIDRHYGNFFVLKGKKLICFDNGNAFPEKHSGSWVSKLNQYAWGLLPQAETQFSPEARELIKSLREKQGSMIERLKQNNFLNEEQEKAISAIAEKANKTEDVITESMAEIWEKQGNNRRAIATYQKLSFIFPEKSVYFASRIEQLKQKK